MQATSTRRALLLTALGGLLIAGVTTALPAGADGPGRLVGYSNAAPSGGSRPGQALDKARPGDCLNWPNKAPDQASIVDCKNDHRFEVASSVDMRTFPGSEYGPNAAAPTAARIQQISQEQCQAAVERYLGAKYDPDSKFTIGMLWSGEKAWSQSGERRMLCGLQLPGAVNDQQQVFKGRVADLDQSKIWQAGTCLGIDTTANQPTDIPVDCAGPHAMEVTGFVNVAEKFPGGPPAEADQDGYIKDACTRMTDAYLAPVQLRATTLTLTYNTISLPSWSAGSHEVACSVGATLGNGGWSTLVGSAKGPLLINGQPAVAPPDIPIDRLNLPPMPMPMPMPTTIDTSGTQPGSQPGYQPQQTLSPVSSAPTIGTQHLPNAPGPQTVDAPAAPGQQPGPAAPQQPQDAGSEPVQPMAPAPPPEPAEPAAPAPPPGG
ncbi:MAG: septum formation family protein [Mycobacteriaceae bacterium]|nr:septum formation family protein [Mycobacteriaceae bacterium]